MKQPTANILVVDDEALVEYLILQKFRRQIREDRYRFVFAQNGREALDQLQINPPIDMVLTDIRMPEMDGLTLLEKLKELDTDIKAVVVSAYGDMRNIRTAMNRGAFDFLIKPIDLDDLEATIQKTLEHIAQIRQAQAQLRQAQEQLRYFAFHDVLTNLANRHWFQRALAHTIELNRRDPAHTYAVVLLDLDRFKMINESHGHVVGDYLLISVAARLQDGLRSSDTVARLGGDEFAILIEGFTESQELMPLLQRIQEALVEPFQVGEHRFHISASIGITTSANQYTDAESALRDADVAMYRAKDQALPYALFDPAMQAQIAERLSLENDLRRAITSGEIVNHFQPIVDLSSGRPVGFEVLARWSHPRRGWVSPGVFITLAEEAGLIQELGRALFRDACRQLHDWQRQFPDHPLTLNLNVSLLQLRAAPFIEEIRENLARYGLSGEAIKLELTESTLQEDLQTYSRLIAELTELNVKLSIDDFGTGYSSLSRLHSFPIAALKIDQSFVRQMTTSEPHLATVKVIIALAQMLGMEVVAEGVERQEELDILLALGCAMGQGYMLSAPLDAEAATRYLGQRQIG